MEVLGWEREWLAVEEQSRSDGPGNVVILVVESEHITEAGESDEELETTLRANSASETGFEEPTVEIPHHGRVAKTSPEAEAALEALLPQAFELLVVGIEKLIERG